MADQYSIYFIACFLARAALIGARRCSSAKRRAAFTSLADSDPGYREARAGRVRGQHDKLLRVTVPPPAGRAGAARAAGGAACAGAGALDG
jgi:hypothetical protein